MTISGLCQAMAATWARARGVSPTPTEPVVAYTILLVGHHRGGRRPYRAEVPDVILLPRRADFAPETMPEPGTPAKKAVHLVVADMGRLSGWLGQAAMIHRCLVCGGRWIGGLLWPANADAEEFPRTTPMRWPWR